MKTVEDLINALAKFPPDMKVYTRFDAGGNYYYPDPELKPSSNRQGEAVLVIDGKVVKNIETIKDIVD